ncbi:hypothetical protein Emtol_2305 [Emticicia oligotrophica DSM 17448]|jgi:hypothetical protein|uniref:DUF4296 domain-containing protein n=1 Tax=Emticicia oligotrophica (strain DSM 17448 / CIP 109782 / MTCC 6937 / GPTSA100-15) TaxID=929562 RepID=A0ABM5N1X2_EMTOG|nr:MULTISPECIES: DUF4296 domain-containing protein [Emticicia]AFK03443.1 hypothetical protein Emtol_2305 [Emticicia oligotrophica DSM 17448]
MDFLRFFRNLLEEILLRKIRYFENEDKPKMLTKKIFLLLGTILILLGCNNQPSKPKDAIDEATMAKILAEIHITEARVSRLSFQAYDSTKVVYKFYEQQIMAKYKTDTARYRASYNYYVTNPEQMTKLYEQVIKNIEELKKKKKLAY